MPQLLSTEDEYRNANLFVDSAQTLIILKPALYRYSSGGVTAHAIIGLSGTQTVYHYITGSRYSETLSKNINGCYYNNFTRISGYTLPFLNPNYNLGNVSTQDGTQLPVFSDAQELIEYCCGNPITYNWQSVPSISGKNGILSLVTLDSESVNDGEPVSGAAVSVFDQNPVSGNNVKDIVDGNTPLIPSAVDVTAAFIISNPPVGELASRILAAKKDSIPESIEDADKTVSIPADASNVTMPDLDENSQYYFAIFVADAVGDTAVSDPKDIYTSADEGWTFDYTGSIQTFVAPKTGVYQLETWGAQGGDATDEIRTARGGYGAYAVGEVLLQQGDTLYINVGGQNGYGGGGAEWITGEYNYSDVALSQNCSNYINSGADSGGQVVEDNEVYFRPYFYTDKMFEMGTEYRRACINNTEDNCYEVPMPPSSLGDNNPYTVWQLPIKNMRNITKIDIEVKMTKATYTNEEHWIGFQFIKFTSASERAEVGGNQITIGRYNPNGNYSYYDYYYLDDNWHTLSLSFSNVDYADYISIASVRGQYDFRIKKIYGDLQYP